MPPPLLAPQPGDLPVALSIATSDSGCGAGLQADLLTFAARGVFGLTTFCCLTAQNPAGVSAVAQLDLDFIRAQLDQTFSWFAVRAVKTGMLFTAPIIQAVADYLRAYPGLPLVVDPVMVASSGAVLLQPEAVATLRSALLPLATVVTPNLDEAAVLLGSRPSGEADMRAAARTLAEAWGCAVLLKGGHLGGDRLLDVLADPAGGEWLFPAQRIVSVDTHGSGCTLAAALAAALARGLALPEAVADAHAYLQRALAAPLQVSGRRFINHGVA